MDMVLLLFFLIQCYSFQEDSVSLHASSIKNKSSFPGGLAVTDLKSTISSRSYDSFYNGEEMDSVWIQLRSRSQVVSEFKIWYSDNNSKCLVIYKILSRPWEACSVG